MNVILSRMRRKFPSSLLSSCLSCRKRFLVFISRMPRVLDRPDKILITPVTRETINLQFHPSDTKVTSRPTSRAKTYPLVRRTFASRNYAFIDSQPEEGWEDAALFVRLAFSQRLLSPRPSPHSSSKFSVLSAFSRLPVVRRAILYASSLLRPRKIAPRASAMHLLDTREQETGRDL